MKKIIRFSIESLIKGLSGSRLGELIFKEVIQEVLNRSKKVTHNGVTMRFAVPNWLNHYRADSFAIKEPETLTWIEQIPDGSVVWDIGANVGLYSIYAASLRYCKVYAFEPSVFNLELLARNIYFNSLQNKIVIVPVALSNSISENLFRMSSTQWGGALSTFGENIDQHGNPFKQMFEYRTIGLPADNIHVSMHIQRPDFIKMDVDGIEHFIMQGGKDILSTVKSVLVEINDDFTEQSSVSNQILSSAGLTLYKKCKEGVAEDFHQYNQWWVRS